MVAKHMYLVFCPLFRLNLAKIHMVAKLHEWICKTKRCLNLAKIHMVAKRVAQAVVSGTGLNLAKIHMVAKHH